MWLGYLLQIMAGVAVAAIIVALLPPAGGNVPMAVSTALDKALHTEENPTYAMDQITAHLVPRESGYVEILKRGRGWMLIEGWAADTIANKPARSVQVLLNGRNVGAVIPRYNRPDVANALAIATSERFGFKARVAAKPDEDARVFAEMHDGSFSELRLPSTAR